MTRKLSVIAPNEPEAIEARETKVRIDDSLVMRLRHIMEKHPASFQSMTAIVNYFLAASIDLVEADIDDMQTRLRGQGAKGEQKASLRANTQN